MSEDAKDLIILVADKSMEQMVKAIISRPRDLNIRSLGSFKIYNHPRHDPGCYQHSPDYLRPFINEYHYCLVMFDRDFDKKKDRSASGLESEVKERLEQNGWEGRCEAVGY